MLNSLLGVAPSGEFVESRFNPRTPGGVRLDQHLRVATQLHVSIHAPREGCDTDLVDLLDDSEVSIHAPREGCDKRYERALPRQKSFNSRTPGGVRHWGTCILRPRILVSIHAPREGCDCDLRPSLSPAPVSIHAPREGCDPTRLYCLLPTHGVSIHAPREGCDISVPYHSCYL